MRPFIYERVGDAAEAVQTGTRPARQLHFLAGGTTLLDLMKLDVERPRIVADINELEGSALGRIASRPDPYVVAGVDDSAHLYAFGAVRTKVDVVHADRNTPGYMRSPPVVPYIYALESALDELAAKLGIDPIELRRINDTAVDPIDGRTYSSRSLMRCYDEAAQAFRWRERDPRPGSMRDGDWRVGMGCATALYPTHVGVATARVRLQPDGKARVQTAAHEIGNGAYTVIGQMATERLGVPLSSVAVELGDSNLPPAPIAGGSNTTAGACPAVLRACDAIRGKLLHAAVTANAGALAAAMPRRSRSRMAGSRRRTVQAKVLRSRSNDSAPASSKNTRNSFRPGLGLRRSSSFTPASSRQRAARTAGS
jgi:CO/xanthine dehydrogenase Mo-binding subunit